jgi:hypothetical protein
MRDGGAAVSPDFPGVSDGASSDDAQEPSRIAMTQNRIGGVLMA